MAPTTMTLLFSSKDTSQNNVAANGSGLTTYFEPPITVPSSAKSCTVALVRASIINSFDNIITGVNDKVVFKGPGDVGYITQTLQSGMYSVTDLSTAVNGILLKYTTGVSDSIVQPVTIAPEYATNDIVLTFNLGQWTLDFSVAGGFNNVLGFASVKMGAEAAPPGTVYRSTELSTYSDFPSLVIRSSLSKSRYNGQISNVLDQFEMQSAIGFVNVYQPYYLNRTDGSQLIGKETTEAVFTIENPSGKRPTINDVWTITVEIQYE